MKSSFTKIVFTSFLLFTFILRANAQDPHYSQFDASPLMLNPAFTGMIDQGELRAVTQYRRQWASVNSNFTTTSFAFDVPLDQRWGIGGYLLNEDMGGKLNVNNFVLSGAYDVASPDQDKHKILMGLHLGLIYKNLPTDELIFDEQYLQNEGNFDADIAHGENLDQYQAWMPEATFGVAYMRTEEDKIFNPAIGFSLFHLLHPKQSMLNDKNSRLPLRYVLHGGSRIKLDDQFYLHPRGVFMYQRNAFYHLYGMSGYYALPEQELKMMLGGYWRLNDAIIPSLGMNYKGLTFRVSYDINYSDLQEFSRGRGGIEFSLIFKGKQPFQMINWE